MATRDEDPNDEMAAFQERRDVLRQSAYGNPSPNLSMQRMKKKKLTPEQRRQQMKGLSKAFISSGDGWSKVDPIHVEEESSSESSLASDRADSKVEEEEVVRSSQDIIRDDKRGTHQTGASQPFQQSNVHIHDKQLNANNDHLNDSDVVALMRNETKKILQQKNSKTALPNPLAMAAKTVGTTTVTKTSSNMSAQTLTRQLPQQTLGSPPQVTRPTHPVAAPKEQFRPVHGYSSQATDTASTSTRITRNSDIDVKQVQALHRLLQIANQRGMEEAWHWARDQVVKSGVPNVWNEPPSFSSQNGTTTTTLESQEKPNQQQQQQQQQQWAPAVSLPRPLRLAVNGTKKALDDERQFYPFFRQAVQCTPFEYISRTSTTLFAVRRPYGLDSLSKFFENSPTPSQQYNRKAHVSDLSTLEVVVVMKPQFVVLLVVGKDGARYRNRPRGEFLDKKSQSASLLGSFSFRDGQGRVTEYSLDDLYQEALLVREHYAATITSTAMGFEMQPPTPVPTPPSHPPETRNVATNTDGTIHDLQHTPVLTEPSGIKQYPRTRIEQSLHHLGWWLKMRVSPHTSTLLLLGLAIAIAFYFIQYPI